LHQRAWLLGSGAHPVKPQAKHNRSFSHINPHKMQCVCDVRPLRRFEFTKDTLISGLNPASVAAVFRQIPGGNQWYFFRATTHWWLTLAHAPKH
jgi:hypothetical protein